MAEKNYSTFLEEELPNLETVINTDENCKEVVIPKENTPPATSQLTGSIISYNPNSKTGFK